MFLRCMIEVGYAFDLLGHVELVLESLLLRHHTLLYRHGVDYRGRGY